MVKLALVGTAFVAVSVMGVLASDGAFARGGGGGHSSGSHSTSGYYRANGTYVQGYHATNPNSTKLDNYSTQREISTPGRANPARSRRTELTGQQAIMVQRGPYRPALRKEAALPTPAHCPLPPPTQT
jgi:hypothetical protein